MTLARTTAAAALAYAQSLLGWSRKTPNCPWATNPNEDDCSEFQSHVVFGGRPGPIAWVDNWKIAIDGTYHRGHAGLQPGDVILFDWDGNGVGNHVEMCFTAPGTSRVQTIGANGSDTIAVAYRKRALSYVMGYFRPAYGTAGVIDHTTEPGASSGAISIDLRQRAGSDTDMITILNQGTGDYFGVAPHFVHHLGSTTDATLSQNVFSDIDETHKLTAAQTDTLFAELDIPRKYVSAKTLVAEHPDGLWSLQREIATKLGVSN
jgi:hypothetical protein